MKQKFKRGDHVVPKHSMFTDAVYWIVVLAQPDERGYIVSVNRFGEYVLFHQSDIKEVT